MGRVASVASFFISRVDTAVDKALEEIGNTEIQGKIAATARVQRPLWASTSSKNPAYPDTLYVDNLIGPDTVNTLPPATLDAGSWQSSYHCGLMWMGLACADYISRSLSPAN